MICKNCEKECDGNFCPECGQKTSVGRLTVKSMVQNVILGIFNCDRGILFTVKSLYTRPGCMIGEYLEGKRARYFAPFQMLFVLAAIYLIFYNLFGLEKIEEYVFEKNKIGKFYVSMEQWMTKYIAFLWLSMVPLFSVMFRFVYGKRFRRRYNWAETFFINAYLQTQQIVLAIGMLFVVSVFKVIALSGVELSEEAAVMPEVIMISGISNCFTILGGIVLPAWTMRQLYGGSWVKNLLRVFLVNTLSYLVVVSVVVSILVVVIMNWI